ncbi:MAG TPA: murein biosynthesis integral membrane protein MurJ [Anaerolineales bacterium]|nr:murein biosynthesis integral membrane protein MurJ [Anaerolineales bacterium]
MSRIARASLIIAVFFGVDKVLGFVRQVLIARQFGLTYEIDVFNAANNIPDLLSALISGGALGVALIPVLSEYLQLRSRQEAWDLFSRILNLAFIATGALSLGIAIFAEPLVHRVIAPGFPPDQLALTVSVMRLDLIAILIFSISGLIMAGLQANQHFLLPAMAPMFYNLGQIFGVAILAPQTGISIGPITLPAFGLGIYGLVYGVLIGAALHLAIQIPGLIAYHFHWTPAINLRNPGVVKVLHLLGPRILTMFFLQVFFIARDNIASRYGEGAITALNYGWFIMQVPETLIGTAIAIALLPTISEQFARGEEAAYRDTVNHAVRVILALTLPVATLLIVAIRPLIAGIFGFDAEGTQLVFLASSAYLLGLAGHSLLEVSARSFYARQDARTPLFAAALNAGAYIVLAVWLSSRWGPPGIALANSLAFTGEALLLLFLLNRKVPGMLRLGTTLLRTALASLAGGLLVFGLMQLSFSPVLLSLVALSAGGLVVLPFIWPELKLLIRL